MLDPKPLSLAKGKKKLPHVYSTSKQELCLYYPKDNDWNASMLYVNWLILIDTSKIDLQLKHYTKLRINIVKTRLNCKLLLQTIWIMLFSFVCQLVTNLPGQRHITSNIYFKKHKKKPLTINHFGMNYDTKNIF